MKKKNNKKSGKDKLAAGAEAIRQAEKEAKKVEPFVIPASTRPIDDIVRDRVTMAPGHIGVKLADATPIEEALRVLDWTMTLSDHVGFMIGDVLNFGEAKWGAKYEQALIQTGRALSTLKAYSEASRKIAVKDRQAALSFSQHREILRIGDEAKVASVLKEVAKQVESGKPVPVKELRIKVQHSMPRKVKKPKKVTSGKGKSKGKRKEVKPYEPTPDENAALDMAEASISEASKTAKENGVAKITYKLDNKEKHRWLKLLQPFQEWFFTLEKVTGYD